MTRSEYARHRGVSKPYITKLIATGRISVDANGQIDPVVADRILDERDPLREASTGNGRLGGRPCEDGSPTRVAPPKPSPSSPTAPDVPQGPSRVTLLQARTAHEAYKAEREKIALQIDKKAVVDREAVKTIFAEAMVVIATQMDGLGGRLASELAGMTNPAEIQALLLRETRRIRSVAASILQKMVEK